jgi:hypothetical protein
MIIKEPTDWSISFSKLTGTCRDADKSLGRRERKQAPKHIGTRDFNNVE